MSSCGCSSCTEPNYRKDFRQSKGDGPEVPPHRKKRTKGPTIRTDHKHIYETNGWVKHFHAKYKPGFGYVTDYERWYWIRKYECLECGKRGDYQYRWQTEKPQS